MTNPDIACELLKLLRGTWMDRKQIADWLGVKLPKASHWVDEWHRQGMLDERDAPKPARGHAPKEYTLSARWIGGDR